MAQFASLFSTASPYQDIVDSATSELLMAQDWTKTFEIIDKVNSDPKCSVDIVNALKRRITSKNTVVVIRTLQLIDALIKNCTVELHKAMSDKWYSLLEKLAIGRRGPEVQTEALLLIQRCGKAFMGMQREAPMFYRLYESLKNQSIRFPEDDEATNNAMLAPPKAVIAEAQKQRATAKEYSRKHTRIVHQRSGNNSKIKKDALSKLKKELAMVEERAKRFKSLKLKPESEVYLDEVDFLKQCRERLQELVASISQVVFDEKLLSRVLNMNDLVTDCLISKVETRKSTLNAAKDDPGINNKIFDLSNVQIGTSKISTAVGVEQVNKVNQEDENDGNDNSERSDLIEFNASNATNDSVNNQGNPFDVHDDMFVNESNKKNLNEQGKSTGVQDSTNMVSNQGETNTDIFDDFFSAQPTATEDTISSKNKATPKSQTGKNDLLDDFFS